jgi:hypothetical protein
VAVMEFSNAAPRRDVDAGVAFGCGTGPAERFLAAAVGELAARGAELLQITIGRWVAKHQWLVVIGPGGVVSCELLPDVGFELVEAPGELLV